MLLEAARITDQAGVDAIGAKGFKEMVKMIESKDSDVRNATLDALVAAFSQAHKIGGGPFWACCFFQCVACGITRKGLVDFKFLWSVLPLCISLDSWAMRPLFTIWWAQFQTSPRR